MTPSELMVKARQAVSSARLLLQSGDLDGAVNRAYYAMFHAARAALEDHGEKTDDIKHGTVVGLFGRHFVKAGPLPREIGRAINDALALRQEADYAMPAPALVDVQKVVVDAEKFVSVVDAQLKV